MRNVALDTGKGKYVLCEVRDGKVVDRATARNEVELVRLLGPHTPPARVAFEACRQGWWLHDRLKKWGHEPLMLDSTRIRRLGVGHHRRKNDPIDAEVIALALERGYVHVAHVLSEDRREIRNQIAIRAALIETRTKYINVMRGLGTSAAVALPSCSSCNFVKHARAATWPEAMRVQIEPLIDSLEQHQKAIDQATQRLESLCAKEPTAARLATVPYVGLVVAATFVSVIDDAGRFRDGDQVASYLGLVPSENTSNSAPRLGSITKAGNRWARVMLVQSAWLMLSKGDPNDPLVVWARSVWERRNKFIATVALARKLAITLWAIWRNGAVYATERTARTAQEAGYRTNTRIEDAIAAAKRKLARKVRPRRATRSDTTEASDRGGTASNSTTKRAARARVSSHSHGGKAIATI